MSLPEFYITHDDESEKKTICTTENTMNDKVFAMPVPVGRSVSLTAATAKQISIYR